ncbi:MAG: lipoate--protein ligase family protein [Pirellula sp.]|nr:lipoate--protein ligase family protein [Pirellula sp.]
MYHLPLTLETPAANLALDEALLDAAVEGQLPGEVLRLWEPAEFFVVLGRSSKVAEIHAAACRQDNVAVLRRPSGGATILTGPGCLMYAVLLDAERRPELRSVDRAHELVLGTIERALAPLAPGIARHGTSDLTIPAVHAGDPPVKFSGNSLRLRRGHLLYHGTILYDFPLDRIATWLADPARRPTYRGDRDHRQFVTNFPATRQALESVLTAAWQANEPLVHWPRERTNELATSRYSTVEW